MLESDRTAPRSSARRLARWFALCATAALLCVGCGGSGNKQPQPETLPPSSSVNYATSYPQRVTTTREQLDQQQTAAQNTVDEMQGLPERLSEPNWRRVQMIVELADADGRNEAFGERVEETGVLERFVAEHGDEFARALGRDVDRALEKELGEKQKFEARRPVRSSLNSSLEEHRLEQLHQVSDALQAVEYFADDLGKNGEQTMHDQALAIALASYVAHVEVVEQRNRLENELAQSKEVRTTLEDNLKAIDEEEKNPDLTPSQHGFNEKRRASINEALARIDQDVVAGQKALEQADKDIKTLQDAYEKAYTALHDDLEKRATEQEQAQAAAATP